MKLIIDTDFGDDIDDTFALAYLLRRARADIALIVTACGKTAHRAALLRDFLARAGCGDIPVAAGVECELREPYRYEFLPPQQEREEADGVSLASGLIGAGGCAIVALGPMTNLAALARRSPAAAARTPVYAMLGSIYRGYFDAPSPEREYNAFADAPAAYEFLRAFPLAAITPLDSCGIAELDEAQLARALSGRSAVTQALKSDWEKWLTLGFFKKPSGSSVLYDAVAAYMALGGGGLRYERLPLSVESDGSMLMRDGAPVISAATGWTDYPAFTRALVSALE